MQPAPSPVLLSYDDLSPGSDIHREFADGVVRITIPPGEPPPAVLKQARFDAIIESAFISSAFLLAAAAALIIALRARRFTFEELALIWGLFAVVCGTAILLIASVRFAAARDALRTARQQSTAIAATPARLLIESTGPFGVFSYEIPTGDIAAIRIATSRWHDELRREFFVEHLRVVLNGDRAVDFIPGRSRDELRFVARAIGAAIGQSVLTR